MIYTNRYTLNGVGATSSMIISNLQLEEGETATAYEPYHAPITTNIYLDEPLRKIGDYADYIDFKKGKVIRKIGEKTFSTGGNSYTSSTSNKEIFFSLDIFSRFSIYLSPIPLLGTFITLLNETSSCGLIKSLK